MTKLQLAIVLSLSILMAFEPGSLGGKPELRWVETIRTFAAVFAGEGPALWSMGRCPHFPKSAGF